MCGNALRALISRRWKNQSAQEKPIEVLARHLRMWIEQYANAGRPERVCKPDSVPRQSFASEQLSRRRSFFQADGCPSAQAPYPSLMTVRARPCSTFAELATY